MKRKDKILLFGGSGLLGSHVVSLLSSRFNIIAPSHDKVDITVKYKVQGFIEKTLPDQILFAAGLIRVDVAEKNKDLTYLLNTYSIQYIGDKALELNIPVHYLSTDAVFDGKQKEEPYTEDDKPNPVSLYGKSKLEGENITLNLSTHNSVLRLIMIYASKFDKKKDFVRMAINSLANGKKIFGIIDQVINPIFVEHAVYAIEKILHRRATGIYHLGSIDYTTNYEFIKKLAHIFTFDENLIIPITLNEFFKDNRAKRGRYCWLSIEKFRKRFGEGILHTNDESIALFKNRYSFF